jgi:hypothetical protein
MDRFTHAASPAAIGRACSRFLVSEAHPEQSMSTVAV